MEDLSSMEVGETVRNVRDDDREYRIVEKETSSVGKINAVGVRVDLPSPPLRTRRTGATATRAPRTGSEPGA